MGNFVWIQTNVRGSGAVTTEDALSIRCNREKKTQRRVLILSFYRHFVEEMGLEQGQRMLVGLDHEDGRIALLFGDEGNTLRDMHAQGEDTRAATLGYSARVGEEVPLFGLRRIKTADIQQDNNMLTFDAPWLVEESVAQAEAA